MIGKRIYLDYAALTPLDARVAGEMKKYSSMEYGNPSSLYTEGVSAQKILTKARGYAADFLHAHADEIVFTSGGTEANGLALEGIGRAAHEEKGVLKPHILISAIEHSSIVESARMIEKHGCEVTRVSVDTSGIVNLEELKKSIQPNTILVSIMTVNNEVGSVQPIREIAKIVRQARKLSSSIYPLFHTDAAQAAAYQELAVEKLGVDLLTLDGTKVYGPRGIGCLYVKRGTPIQPIMYGGGQEKGLRSGTENIPAIAGFAKALEIAQKERDTEAQRLSELRSYFINKLTEINADITINGARSSESQSPHILNVSIPGIDNEFFVLQLDAKGIACSTKSSCLHDEDESYVLRAMKVDSATSVRFSLGRYTSKRDINKTCALIRNILKK